MSSSIINTYISQHNANESSLTNSIFIFSLLLSIFYNEAIFQEKQQFPKVMEEKENGNEEILHSKRYRGRRNHKLGEQGNDYVLKRYRLEENRHFKDKLNEDLNYQLPQKQSKPSAASQQLEEDLVIVPLDIQPDPQEDEEDSKEEVEPSDMVYVFDDEEEEEKKEQKLVDVSVPTQLLEKNSLKIERTNIEILQPKKKIVRIKDVPEELQQNYNFKRGERSNFSTAQLMTPSSHQSKSNIFGFGVRSNQVELEKKSATNFEEDCLQKVLGVQFQKGENITEDTITIVDKRLFAISKLPSGIILRCILKRTNSFINLLSPEYDLYLANGLKHILSAKKYPMRNRQLFKFSIDPVKYSDPNIISVLHSNTNHNIYWLLNLPKRIGEFDLSFLQLVIGYYKMKSSQQQRRFTALLPTVNLQYQLAIDYQQSFINFSSFKEEIKVQLNNLQKWSNQVNNSTKNFVLADEDDQDYRYLELKKESDNVFELTIQHPLSPLQAMAIAMTRFDAQLK